ncbi:MAG: hypothetical protein JXI32_09305 [Deltaproteobacteria bacterium]|nr:hypothetical protein [Deltaproteobacteria bacterium]
MKNRGKIIGLLVLCLATAAALASCATDMSTRASRVRLISAEQVHQCEVLCEALGNVQGSSYPAGGCFSWWGTVRKIAHNNALNELLDNAAEIGATHVFVNLGDYPDLRGEAYRCAYCVDANGDPDVAYCVDAASGKRRKAHCRCSEGKALGAAYCRGADGKDPADCRANGGTWVPAVDETECEALGGTWVPEPGNREACEATGDVWIPVARDPAACEYKGGKWIINRDVLRRLPSGSLPEEMAE